MSTKHARLNSVSHDLDFENVIWLDHLFVVVNAFLFMLVYQLPFEAGSRCLRLNQLKYFTGLCDVVFVNHISTAWVMSVFSAQYLLYMNLICNSHEIIDASYSRCSVQRMFTVLYRYHLKCLLHTSQLKVKDEINVPIALSAFSFRDKTNSSKGWD